MTCFLNSPDARLLLEADRCTWVWARVSANLVFLSSGTVDTWTQRQWLPVSTGKVEKIFVYGTDDQWWWWIYRTPVWQLSKLAGLLSQHRHHYKQQAPGGEIEQITTFTTAFDVIISSRIITSQVPQPTLCSGFQVSWRIWLDHHSLTGQRHSSVGKLQEQRSFIQSI